MITNLQYNQKYSMEYGRYLINLEERQLAQIPILILNPIHSLNEFTVMNSE